MNPIPAFIFDKALKYLYENDSFSVSHRHYEKGISDSDADEVIEKLHSLQWITTAKKGEITCYYITTKGRDILRSGGYAQYLADEEAEKQARKRKRELEHRTLEESLAFIKTQRIFLYVTAAISAVAIFISLYALNKK